MHHRLPFDSNRLRKKPQPEAAFIAALARYQDSLPEGKREDLAFVDRIGVSPALWRQTRSGRIDLGIKLLMAGADLVGHSTFEAAQRSVLNRVSSRGTKSGEAA